MLKPVFSGQLHWILEVAACAENVTSDENMRLPIEPLKYYFDLVWRVNWKYNAVSIDPR